MVNLAAIQSANANFAARRESGQVAVFLGATSGIGQSTLHELATLLVKPKLYVVGRSKSRFSAQRDSILRLNAEAEVVFLEAEVSLLAEIDRVCVEIAAAESRVDYLCMSSGYLPLQGAVQTKEGLEQCFALSYYSRLRLLHNLLPLLRNSQRPRVLSILNGGGEGPINENDVALRESWTVFSLVNHTTTLTTLAFERLAEQNPNIAFMHAGPGQVRTQLETKIQPTESDGFLTRVFYALMRNLVWIIHGLVAISPQESGERHAYLLTSDAFGPGLSRVGPTSDEAPPSALVDGYQKAGWVDKAWDFTHGTWEDTLGPQGRG